LLFKNVAKILEKWKGRVNNVLQQKHKNLLCCTLTLSYTLKLQQICDGPATLFADKRKKVTCTHLLPKQKKQEVCITG